jgi:hypothetical protein
MADYNIAVSALSPSQWVHRALCINSSPTRASRGEQGWRVQHFAGGRPAEKINGRVTYSQQILSEYGLIASRTGAASPRLGYSQI